MCYQAEELRFTNTSRKKAIKDMHLMILPKVLLNLNSLTPVQFNKSNLLYQEMLSFQQIKELAKFPKIVISKKF